MCIVICSRCLCTLNICMYVCKRTHNTKIITLGTLLYLFKYFGVCEFSIFNFFRFRLGIYCVYYLFSPRICSRFLPFHSRKNNGRCKIKSIAKWIHFLLLVKSYFLLCSTQHRPVTYWNVPFSSFCFVRGICLWVVTRWMWMHCTVGLDNNKNK